MIEMENTHAMFSVFPEDAQSNSVVDLQFSKHGSHPLDAETHVRFQDASLAGISDGMEAAAIDTGAAPGGADTPSASNKKSKVKGGKKRKLKKIKLPTAK
jgi:hypothetical protein